jgi:hypothetical protein
MTGPEVLDVVLAFCCLADVVSPHRSPAVVSRVPCTNTHVYGHNLSGYILNKIEMRLDQEYLQSVGSPFTPRT